MTRNRVLVTLLALSATLTTIFIGGSFVTYAQSISSSEMQNIYLARITKYGGVSLALQLACLIMAVWPRSSK